MNENAATLPPLDIVHPDVRDLLRGQLTLAGSTTIHTVTIDGWFGPKWLGFRGKALGALGIHDSVHDENVAIPPFVPARVLREERWSFSSGIWERELPARPLHIAQRSEANQARKIRRLTTPGTLLAWCGHTAPDRTSLMVYIHIEDALLGWHIAVYSRGGETVYTPTGLTSTELDYLRARGA